MKLFVFVCKNVTNIWAGVGARRWAVSEADPNIMSGRETRIANLSVGCAGLIYCSHESKKSLTTPFIITSVPRAEESENEIWPETWRMPFHIHPLGTPRKNWSSREAASTMPFNKDTGNTNISSVFKTVGAAVFSPVLIGDADWAMIIDRLGDERLI